MSELQPPAPLNTPATQVGSLMKREGFRLSGDATLSFACRASAVGILVMLTALLVLLLNASLPAIKAFGAKFITGTEWRANALETPKRDATGKIIFNDDNEMTMDVKPPVFGALPVIYGTAVSSAIALLFAVPLSFGAALFLVRIAPNWLKGPTSFLIEFLAAIPSIAYGIWGLFVLVPLLQNHIEPALAKLLAQIPGLGFMLKDTSGRELAFTGKDMLSGGLILGIMILPIITAISRDVLNAVPRAQIEGTLALGATWWQSAKQMLAYSRSGLFGAIMLGLARAAGETMAVTMVIGNSNKIVPSLFAPAQTMSSLLASEFQEASDVHRSALTEVALILLVMSLLFNIVARWLVVGKNSRTAGAH